MCCIIRLCEEFDAQLLWQISYNFAQTLLFSSAGFPVLCQGSGSHVTGKPLSRQGDQQAAFGKRYYQPDVRTLTARSYEPLKGHQASPGSLNRVFRQKCVVLDWVREFLLHL